MAYPNYTGYNPVYQSPYNQPYAQPQFNAMQQNAQQINRTGIEVMYATESEATNYLINPNEKKLFIITDKPMAIFKSSDPMGISTFKRYKMEELNESSETKTSEFDPKEYARIDDLKGFVTEDKLKSEFKVFSDKIFEEIKRGRIDE